MSIFERNFNVHTFILASNLSPYKGENLCFCSSETFVNIQIGTHSPIIVIPVPWCISSLTVISTECPNWIDDLENLICCSNAISYLCNILRSVFRSSVVVKSCAKSWCDIFGLTLTTFKPVSFFSRFAFHMLVMSVFVHKINKYGDKGCFCRKLG